MLKIDISGDREKKEQEASEMKRDEERFHTPTSLLQKLREIMTQNKELIIIDGSYRPEPHHIVEFTASLRRNSMIQIMEVMVEVMKMITVFSPKMDKPVPQKSKHLPQKRDPTDIQQEQMENFLKILKSGNTIDIISDTLLDCDYRAVITLEQEYLNDPTMSDIVDGQFKVLGKIIRVISDNKQSLSLIRKTPLSILPTATLHELMLKLAEFSKTADIRLPEIEWEITGPVIQIIPIAIFA